MRHIVLITSDHRRHRWLASQLVRTGDLAGVVCERKPPVRSPSVEEPDPTIRAHFWERDEREAYWFASAPHDYEQMDIAVRRVAWQGSNDSKTFRFVNDLSPELVVLFGSSIIREPLLSHFKGHIINMHLGLSPYYRGSATNFWPLVHGLPECVGVTVHYATSKLDGGSILLQARPDVCETDSSHDLGCRAILAGARLLQKLAALAGRLPAGKTQSGDGKLCRRNEFNVAAIRRLHHNFADGMIARYLADKHRRDARYPIVSDVGSLLPAEPSGTSNVT